MDGKSPTTEAELDELLGKPGPPIEIDREEVEAAVAVQRAEAQNLSTLRCIDCGAPATRQSSDGVPLCEGDFWHLVEHWRREGFGREGGTHEWISPLASD